MKKKEETGFGARLKSLREERGMTQQQLADAAGMNKFGLAKLEQGVTEPYWPTVLKLAKALNVTCEAFAGVLELKDEANSGTSNVSESTAKPKPAKKGKKK